MKKLKQCILSELDRLTRQYKESLYREYFSLPQTTKVRRFAYLRKIGKNNYYYFNTFDRHRNKEKSIYICRENSEKADIISKIEHDVVAYKKSLIDDVIKMLEHEKKTAYLK